MIIQVYHKTLKQTAYLDNTGEVHKDIKITGDLQLVKILNKLLNEDVVLVVRDMYFTLCETLPKSCFISPRGLTEIYKASNDYMRFFVTEYCKDHQLFEASILKE